MMKKVLSLLLAVILLASLTLTTSTAEEEVFDGYVIVRLCNEGELYYGDDIYLYASCHINAPQSLGRAEDP